MDTDTERTTAASPRPADALPAETVVLPAAPQPTSSGGPSPFVIVGAALTAGVALAKWIDWRGHAHPRG